MTEIIGMYCGCEAKKTSIFGYLFVTGKNKMIVNEGFVYFTSTKGGCEATGSGHAPLTSMILHLRAQGLQKEDEHPPMLRSGVR